MDRRRFVILQEMILAEIHSTTLQNQNLDFHEIEKIILTTLVQHCTREEIAELIGMSERGVWYKLSKLGLVRERKRSVPSGN
jgi:chromosome segregation and condensation protein ScpB